MLDKDGKAITRTLDEVRCYSFRRSFCEDEKGVAFRKGARAEFVFFKQQSLLAFFSPQFIGIKIPQGFSPPIPGEKKKEKLLNRNLPYSVNPSPSNL